MARNSLWGALSTRLFVFSTPALAQFGGSGLHTSELCHGDVYHQPHNWSANECADTYNFAQLSTKPGGDIGVCDSGASGVNNCDGCYACCNGMHAQKNQCLCGQMPHPDLCETTNDRDQMNCRGNCLATYEGNGCDDPNLELP